jgi:hypothetical protein
MPECDEPADGLVVLGGGDLELDGGRWVAAVHEWTVRLPASGKVKGGPLSW